MLEDRGVLLLMVVCCLDGRRACDVVVLNGCFFVVTCYGSWWLGVVVFDMDLLLFKMTCVIFLNAHSNLENVCVRLCVTECECLNGWVSVYCMYMLLIICP